MTFDDDWAALKADAQERHSTQMRLNTTGAGRIRPEPGTPARAGRIRALGIRIPATASDRRAGYKVGERYDTGLLSFVLPADDAETYTGRLIEDGTEMIKNFHPEEKDYRPAAAFGHLGLPEPETFVQGLRTISLCPDDLATSEGKYLQRCVDLFAHEFTPGTTRIYVRSTIEPSVTPPPAPASKAP
ncbi:hypothetical protein ACFPN0_23190 [Kitasatospora cinereorecta]